MLVTGASAHRLEEYLQATRILVSTNRVELFIELTPGVAVAGQVVAVMDTDDDGVISNEEGAAYARRMLEDISVELDGKSLAVTEMGTFIPAVSDMKTGSGVIRIRAAGSIAPLKDGKHMIALTNAHLTSISVYVVNALVPKDPAIKITRQVRDETQMDYRLEFVSDASLP